MSRPRKADAMTSAERVRRYRERQKAVTETQNSFIDVTETLLDGRFCEWFPWSKGCNLDLMGHSSFNVITPSHPRFVCKGDSLHPDWWPKRSPVREVTA
jgi:hypothetical protein